MNRKCNRMYAKICFLLFTSKIFELFSFIHCFTGCLEHSNSYEMRVFEPCTARIMYMCSAVGAEQARVQNTQEQYYT